MTPEAKSLQEIRDAVAGLPRRDRKLIAAAAACIRYIVSIFGPLGRVALYLVSSEKATKP